MSERTTGIHVEGNTPTPETVRMTRDAIMDILNSGADQLTKRVAIRALLGALKLGSVQDVNISHVSIDMGGKP